jgi:hypothetical protein
LICATLNLPANGDTIPVAMASATSRSNGVNTGRVFTFPIQTPQSPKCFKLFFNQFFARSTTGISMGISVEINPSQAGQVKLVSNPQNSDS